MHAPARTLVAGARDMCGGDYTTAPVRTLVVGARDMCGGGYTTYLIIYNAIHDL